MKKYSTKDIALSLSEEEIYKKVSQEEIYRYYIGDYYVNSVMSAPYREDKNPSFVLYYGDNSNLLWFDFGRNKSGGLIKLLTLMFNINYRQALEEIDSSLNLGILNKPKNNIIRFPEYENKIRKVKETKLSVIKQPFNNIDKEYWFKGGISKKTLEIFEVSSTDKVFINGRPIWKYVENNPIYSWEEKGKLKCYRPLNKDKKGKWITDCKQSIIQGYTQLPETGDLLVITKSLKDVMVYYEINIPAIAPQGEYIIISEEVINDFKKRFKKIITNFDNDEAGINLSKEYKKLYNIDYFLLQDYKDPFEYSCNLGLKKLKKLINGIN